MPRAPRAGLRGFTLVELLVAIGIIALLASIALVTGSQVVQSGKARSTEQTLQALDQTLDVYTSEQGAIPPPYARDPRQSPLNQNDGGVSWFVVDGRSFTNQGSFSNDDLTPLPGLEGLSSRARMINSSGWFGAQMSAEPQADAVFSGLPSEVLISYAPLKSPSEQVSPPFSQPLLPTPFDAWGRPIRYVHPVLDGLLVGPAGSNAGTDPVQFITPGDDTYGLRGLRGIANADAIRIANTDVRRNNTYTGPAAGAATDWDLPDSDGGFCPGNRPYFYSAGPDGDPSTLSDNVYLIVPEVDQLRN